MSTEKRNGGIFVSLVFSAILILSLTKILTHKYHSMGVSKFTTLYFIFIAHKYIISDFLYKGLARASGTAALSSEEYGERLGHRVVKTHV